MTQESESRTLQQILHRAEKAEESLAEAQRILADFVSMARLSKGVIPLVLSYDDPTVKKAINLLGGVIGETKAEPTPPLTDEERQYFKKISDSNRVLDEVVEKINHELDR